MRIIGTGLSGLVGSRVVELLQDNFSFTDLSLETGFDITDFRLMGNVLSKSDADWVFHFAARTDVDACETDRLLGKHGATWKINAEATENIARICEKTSKHLLYVSTDFVFDGKKSSYSEDDIPNPAGWYGLTKYEGEKAVKNLGALGLVIRIANPYRAETSGKPDFVHRILDRLNKGLTVISPVDQIFTPTFIDDIASAIRKLVENNISGIIHVTGSSPISPYNACRIIAATYQKDLSLVKPTKFLDFFSKKAPRPILAAMKNAKITNYGIRMASFDEGIRQIQMQERKKI